jgi:hypothetical protein
MLGLQKDISNPNKSNIMKLMSWNVRGLNAPSKHRMLKKRIIAGKRRGSNDTRN